MNNSNHSYTRSERTLAAEKHCQMKKKLASEELEKVLKEVPPEIAKKASSRIGLEPKYRTSLAETYTLASATLRYALLCHYS